MPIRHLRPSHLRLTACPLRATLPRAPGERVPSRSGRAKVGPANETPVPRARWPHPLHAGAYLMRILVLALAFLASSAPHALAWTYEPAPVRTYHARNFARALHAVLSAPCRIAASLGGPCGCYASEKVFGHSVRGLWRADSWLKFPRTSAHVGAVAVWPHHVAVVNSVVGHRVTVDDSWNHHHAVSAPLYVEPR